MNNLKMYSDEFKFKFERFLIGCDSLEEIGLWDKERYGEMDLYYTNDMVSVIIRLIAADGEFSNKEISYLNDIFGFDFSAEELLEVYKSSREGIDSIFDEGMENGLSVMKSMNEKLAKAYRELILLICDIIILSDGEIDKAEVKMAEQLKISIN